MITENALKSYFENLATKHATLQHSPENPSFFYIDNPYELTAIDAALRNMTAEIALLVDTPERNLDDNLSNNYVESINIQFTILKKENDSTLLLEARDAVLPVINDFLVKIRQNASDRSLVGSSLNRMRITNVKIDPVGPMNLEWYGYTVIITVACPLALNTNDAIWLP